MAADKQINLANITAYLVTANVSLTGDKRGLIQELLSNLVYSQLNQAAA